VAVAEVPDLSSLKCSSHWSLGLYPASCVSSRVRSAPLQQHREMHCAIATALCSVCTHLPLAVVRYFFTQVLIPLVPRIVSSVCVRPLATVLWSVCTHLSPSCCLFCCRCVHQQVLSLERLGKDRTKHFRRCPFLILHRFLLHLSLAACFAVVVRSFFRIATKNC
jgi:hypothetical protein